MGSERKKLNHALLGAVIIGDTGRVRELLRQGAAVRARDREHGETPLMLAARFADAAMVRALLDAGAEVDARDDRGRTALSYTPVSSEVFRVLLEAGADVHARDDEGNNILLMKVAESASLAEVEELLRLGIDPSLRNKDGESAMDVADGLGLVLVAERLRSSAATRRRQGADA